MKTPARPVFRSIALLALGGAFAFASLSLARAVDTAMLQRLADTAPAAPLKAAFTKDDSGKNEAPYTLTLTNTGAHAVKVAATIDLSVVVHNRPKSRDVAAQTIEPGKTLAIDDLAAGDKVTVTADGYAPLHLTVH